MKLVGLLLAFALAGCATVPVPQPHPVPGQALIVPAWHITHVAGCMRCQMLEVGQ